MPLILRSSPCVNTNQLFDAYRQCEAAFLENESFVSSLDVPVFQFLRHRRRPCRSSLFKRVPLDQVRDGVDLFWRRSRSKYRHPSGLSFKDRKGKSFVERRENEYVHCREQRGNSTLDASESAAVR